MKESSVSNSRNADLIGALVAGLVVGSIHAWTRSSGGEIYAPAFISTLLLAVGSYSVVALLLPQWRDGSASKIPNWVLIAVVGSLICFLSINLIPEVQYIWRFKDSSVIGYASGAIVEEMIDFVLSSAIDSLIALPIMGTVHYLAQRARATRQRTTIHTT